jgi:phosphate starvation-inducible protein PhoH and related proteins
MHLETVDPIDFFGVNNDKFNLLKKAFPQLKIAARGQSVKVSGDEKDIIRFKQKVSGLIDHLEQHKSISISDFEEILFASATEKKIEEPEVKGEIIVHGQNGLVVRAKTANQKRLVEKVLKNDIVFAIGPAGTGKTYTAVAMAVKALKEKQVKRIILTRPAVEAGENLGFLPGDLKEKIDPYLRPLYDALDDMIHPEKLNYMLQNRIIEIAPLAFMRGRTLDNAFIILDEAQNTTVPQLKMFLTRIGPSAKAIVTGDMTQIDLPQHQKSGLRVALNILENIKGIAILYLTEHDVVRHKLVKKIIKAYHDFGESETLKREQAIQEKLK